MGSALALGAGLAAAMQTIGVAPATADVIVGDAPDPGVATWYPNEGAGVIYRFETGGIECAFCNRVTTKSQAWAETWTLTNNKPHTNAVWKFTANPNLTNQVVGDAQAFISASGIMSNCSATYMVGPGAYRLNQAGYANALVTINAHPQTLVHGTIGLNGFGDSNFCNPNGTKTGWDALRVYY